MPVAERIRTWFEMSLANSGEALPCWKPTGRSTYAVVDITGEYGKIAVDMKNTVNKGLQFTGVIRLGSYCRFNVINQLLIDMHTKHRENIADLRSTLR
jgi:hypothetical protein